MLCIGNIENVSVAIVYCKCEFEFQSLLLHFVSKNIFSIVQAEKADKVVPVAWPCSILHSARSTEYLIEVFTWWLPSMWPIRAIMLGADNLHAFNLGENRRECQIHLADCWVVYSPSCAALCLK